MELRTTKKLVYDLLKENEVLRGDDNLLILEVYRTINPFISSYGFEYVLKNRKKDGLPSFEAIRRSRAKIQAEYPELKGDERIQREREREECKYRDFARE